MKNKVSTPHDKLFRGSMNHPEVARDFLTTHLPTDIVSKIDFNSIVVCPNTFIDEELKLTESDVLIKATMEGQNGYIYILAEHQSTQDPLMPFRLLKYMTRIWDYHQHHGKKKNTLPFPAIIPLVFYTGPTLYKSTRAIWELCGDQSELMRHILSEPFHLIDVNAIPESILTSRMWSGTMEFLMRHRFRQHISQELEKVAHSFNQLLLEDKSQFVLQLLSYIMAVDDEHRSTKDLIELMRNKISPKVGDEIVSLAERLIEEGMEKGREEGELTKSFEIARNMLIEGCDLVFVAKITKLPVSRIKELQKTLC